MSETDLFKVPTEEKAKKTRAKKPMSAERKAQLMENLRRGREKSLKIRQDKAKMKKEAVEETPEEESKLFKEKLVKKSSHSEDGNVASINAELKELRVMLKEMKLERESERQRAEIAELKAKINELNESKKEIKEQVPESKPVPIPETPKPKPPPVQEPPKPPPIRVVHADNPNNFKRKSGLSRFA